jgi:hypothetical protein
MIFPHAENVSEEEPLIIKSNFCKIRYIVQAYNSSNRPYLHSAGVRLDHQSEMKRFAVLPSTLRRIPMRQLGQTKTDFFKMFSKSSFITGPGFQHRMT